MPRENLGELEHQVLLSVLRLGGKGYSVSVVEELEAYADRRVSQAAVFITLQRLERRGLLVSHMEEGGEGEAARTRRYFLLTDVGIERLRDARRMLKRLWGGLERRLDEV
jgi:DNA-binding PadR family transcriptional regulator